MKKLYLLLPIILLVYLGCEDEKPQDRTPPSIITTFPQDGSVVYEVVTITCMSSDNEGVEKVDLWINGLNTGISDNSEPYSFIWNTTNLENGNYTIVIRSHDINDNTNDSEPIILTVDNSLSNPKGSNVISVSYTITEMTIEWEESQDGDFNNYKILFSESEDSNKDTIQTYTDRSITSHIITDFNPLVENWFWIQVTDTMGYSSIGTGMTNTIDLEPHPVDITSVLYNLDSMTIKWDQYISDTNRTYRLNLNKNSSVTNDFFSYELLKSDSEDGTYNLVVEITDQSKVHHSITNFDPTIENWFKIKVTDYWNLTSIGNGMTNQIDDPPEVPVLFQPVYNNNSILVTWLENNQNDFLSYELFESTNSDMSEKVLIYQTNDYNENSFLINDIQNSEFLYYQLTVNDQWGLESSSNIQVTDTRVMFEETYDLIGVGRSVSQTDDGGYIITGNYGSESSPSTLLYKTDNLGQVEWEQTYNGEIGYTVQQTSDGGFICFGYIRSGNFNDTYVLKTNSVGITEWSIGIGETGPLNEISYDGCETSDGGYIITGSRTDPVLQSLLMKINSQGEFQWDVILGVNQTGYSVQQTIDGGYIVSGEDNNDGYRKIFLTKTSSLGSFQWTQTYGLENDGYGGSSVQQTPDEGFIIRGYTNQDVLLIKTDSQGEELWNQTIDGGDTEIGISLDQTSDGGYVITGYRNPGSEDVLLMKTDSQGNEEWIRTYGGTGTQKGYSVQITNDGGFIITGYEMSSGSTDRQLLLIKTDSQGNVF